MSIKPFYCLQCGAMILGETFRLYFCSEECHLAFTYDAAQYKEYHKGGER